MGLCLNPGSGSVILHKSLWPSISSYKNGENYIYILRWLHRWEMINIKSLVHSKYSVVVGVIFIVLGIAVPLWIAFDLLFQSGKFRALQKCEFFKS